MKSSRFYQNWLHLVSGMSDILIFYSGYFLDRNINVAISLLATKYIISFSVRELMLKRMKAAYREENEKGEKDNDNHSSVKKD